MMDRDWWLKEVTVDDVHEGLRLLVMIDIHLRGDTRGELGNEIDFPLRGRITCTADAQLAVCAAIERQEEPQFAAIRDVLIEAKSLPHVMSALPKPTFQKTLEFVGEPR